MCACQLEELWHCSRLVHVHACTDVCVFSFDGGRVGGSVFLGGGARLLQTWLLLRFESAHVAIVAEGEALLILCNVMPSLRQRPEASSLRQAAGRDGS